MSVAQAIRADETALHDPVGETDAARAIGFDKSDYRNASAILFDNLDRDPDAVALDGSAGRLTYAELCASASRWGHAFADLGLARGERIAFFLDDTPSYPAAFMGAVRAGYVPVLLNTQTTPDLLQFFLADSGARVAACEASFARQFDAAAVLGTALERIVVANGEAPSDAPMPAVTADAFLKGHPGRLDCADTGPDDMAFWMYSSGSTGRPKGIVHLQHDMAYTHLSYAAHVLGLKPGDRCLSVPKMFFAYGFGNSVTFPFAAGATAVLMPGRPEAARVLATIETHRPTHLFGLPTLYTALARAPEAETTDFTSLRMCLSAAEILSEDVFTAWAALTGCEAIEGLGSTEMLHIYLSNTGAEKRLGSAGRVVPGFDVRLRDADGNAVASGEEGVMEVRGHSSAPLYWNRPDKTAETMRGDWLYTGDRFVEREGFYYFQGRADDLVKVSGQWVWPLEVERCLNEHEAVHECAVLADPMADRRVRLRAVVRLREGHAANDETTERLRAHVKRALLPFKAPRAIEYVDELPKTGTGKIDRQALAWSEDLRAGAPAGGA